MIEKIDEIKLQIGEHGKTKFDIIPKETFGMVCKKINELIDCVNSNNEQKLNYQIDKMKLQISALVNYLMDFMHRELEYVEKYKGGKSKATIKQFHHKIKKHLESLGIDD